MFDTFLNQCRLDYVGAASSPGDRAIALQEICLKIGEIKQSYVGKGGRKYSNNPDEYYNRYLLFIPMLPDDATLWTTPLCSTYFTGLDQRLRDRMLLDQFVMPRIDLLTTKSSQLAALRAVRSRAAVSYKILQDEQERMKALLSDMNQSVSRSGRSHLHVQFEDRSPSRERSPPRERYSNHNHDDRTQEYREYNGRKRPTDVYAYNSQSQAEMTISKYNDGGAPPKQENLKNLPVKVGQDGLLYPFDEESGQMSVFPLGFKGCFRCGGLDHRSRDQCPKIIWCVTKCSND